MLFRGIAELLFAIIIITILRSVIGVLMKMFGNIFGPQAGASPSNPQRNPPRPAVPSGGELKKDPVCGTFIAADTAVQKRVGGELYYFCSPDCRDRFKPHA
jgi:YHS domain-containing protein